MAKIQVLVYYDFPHQKLMLADDTGGQTKCLVPDTIDANQMNISFRGNQCKVKKKTEVKIQFVAAENVRFETYPIVWEPDHNGHVKGDLSNQTPDPAQSTDSKHVTFTYPNDETYNFDLRVKVNGQDKNLDPKIINGVDNPSVVLLLLGAAVTIIAIFVAAYFVRLNRRKTNIKRMNGSSQ